ncbi:MAG: MarR family transcriptional regulator [Bifidobacteriaceae bacterium]|jgi:ATP-dependent DNA helicase RecG|nr:MarR family transcriptional regulator [Bifidobacteriaceae bacterium]
MVLVDSVADAVRQAREAGTDLHHCEIKTAAAGPPKTLAESVSAFANGDGGLIVLGVEERAGFAVVAVDAPRLAQALATACSDQVEPAVRAEISVVLFDGQPVAVAAIPAMERAKKPCYVKTQGLERGSYIRSHDGDRHLSTYEIHSLLTGRGQPKDDSAPVEGTSVAVLLEREVAAYVRRLRDTRGPVFADTNDEQVLRMTGVLAPEGPEVTIAGLLALGRFPQQYLPQMNVTFVAFPSLDARPMADGTRFLDNIPVDGPIPQMVEGTWAALTRNIRRRGVVAGLGREDIWEYPPRAVRELVTNALMHRDYHPLAQGSQVRVELYPDRLEITNPGGLFGAINAEALQRSPITSTRNSVLARLLEDVALPHSEHAVAENRGTGLFVVAGELERDGLAPLEIRTDLLSFTAIMRQGTPRAEPTAPETGMTPRLRQVLDLLASHARSARELADTLGITRSAVQQHLRRLEAAGLVVPTTSARRSRETRWQRTGS